MAMPSQPVSRPGGPAAGARWTRERARRELADGARWDLLVAGGGVIGSALALDAAGRGLRTALAERADFASGASGKSTKLLHGGIRYLPHFRFGLIREGLRERNILRRTADFLYSDLDFTIPLFRGTGLADLPRWASFGPALSPLLRTGLGMYDLLGGRRGGARSRRAAAGEVAEMFPALRTEGLRGGFIYGDASTDDVRLTVCVLKTAVLRHGATALSGAAVESIAPDREGFRATLRDEEGSFQILARSVISATWAHPPPPLEGEPPGPGMRLSKGAHLLYRAEDLGMRDRALVLPDTGDGRIMFVVPWLGMALAGTTDTPYEGHPAGVRPEPEDVEYLRERLARFLDADGAEPVSAFAGLRALADRSGSTAAASRGHKILEPVPGCLRIAGGKLTAFRAIAAEAVDRACAFLGVDKPSRTAGETLVGAGTGGGFAAGLLRRAEALGLPAGYGRNLIARYGRESEAVLRLAGQIPNGLAPVGPSGIIRAEVAYAARCESAGSVADFALRRTHLARISPDRGRSDAPAIAEVLAQELNWPPSRAQNALADYEQALTAEGL